MYGTMTRVAAGCPTTFWERIEVRSSIVSAPCLRVFDCVPLGLSTPTSALIILAGLPLTRVFRRSSGRFGSFIWQTCPLLPIVYKAVWGVRKKRGKPVTAFGPILTLILF